VTDILALDVATNTGFAVGRLGDPAPTFGSARFGNAQTAHADRFAHALVWMVKFLQQFRVDLLVLEAPLHFGLRRGNSAAGNDELAYGLAAVVTAVARQRCVDDIRQARTVDVRRFFLGDNPKRKDAKRQTIERCHALGLAVENDNEADACALWHFQCAQLVPQLGLRVSPLFNRTIALS
jgi:hypothetical protein